MLSDPRIWKDPNPKLCSNLVIIARCSKVLAYGLQGAQLFQAFLKMNLSRLPKYKLW